MSVRFRPPWLKLGAGLSLGSSCSSYGSSCSGVDRATPEEARWLWYARAVFGSVVHLLAIWVVLFAGFWSVGTAAARSLAVELRPVGAFWVGVAVVVLALQWWNLAAPVGPLALVVFIGGAVAASAAKVRRSWPPKPRMTWAIGLASLPLVVWVALRSLQPCDMQDSGVYHLGAILWAAQYPVVPGVANLHPFLGVSHGFFPLAALVSNLPFSLPIHHVLNGLCVLALGGRLVEMGLHRGSWWGSLALLPALVLVAQSPEVSTASSDVLELTMGGAFVCSWLEAFGEAWPSSGEFLLAVLLAVAVVVVKFSSVGALLGVAVVAIASRDRWRSALLAFLGLVPWAVGGAIRTGVWPYPGALVRLPVDWRVPDAVLTGLQNWTLAAGRKSQPWDAPGFGWLPARLEQLLVEFEGFSLPVVGGALLLGLSAPWWWRERRRAFVLGLPLLGAVTVWLFTSPLLRYSGVWLQACFAVALVAARRAPRPLLWLAGLVLVLRAGSLVEELDLTIRPIASLDPPPVEGRWRENGRGLRVFVPEEGRCWTAPLPCTPFLDDALGPRDATSMRAGFRFEADLATLRPSSLRLFPPPTR